MAFYESDRLFLNSNETNDINRVLTMNQPPNYEIIQEKTGIKLIFEFPEKSEEDQMVHREVREMFSELLHEYIQKVS